MSGLPVSFTNTVVRYRHWLLATTVVSVIALPQIVSAFDGTSDARRIIVAQQQEDPKKKKDAPKAQPPQQQQPKAVQPPPQQQPRAVQPPPQQQPRSVQPPPPPQQPRSVQPPPPPQQPRSVQPPPPPVQPKVVQPPQQPKVIQQPPKTVQPPPPPIQPKTVQPPPPPVQPKIVQPPPPGQPKLVQPPAVQPNVVQPPPPPGQPKLVQPPVVQPNVVQPPPPPGQPKLVQPPVVQPNVVQPPPPPGQPKLVQPPVVQPNVVQPPPPGQPKLVQPPVVQPNVVQPNVVQPPVVQPNVVQPAPQPKFVPQNFGQPKAPTGPQIGNVNELKSKRVESKVGNQIVIREPGNRVIIRENNHVIIRHDESERMRRWGNSRFELRGQERLTIVRRGDYEVVTVTDANGHLLRRFRRDSGGREYMLIDNRRHLAIGAAAVAGVVLLGLAMPRITLPRERYLVDIDTAPPVYLYEALEPTVLVPIERAYSLDEVRDNFELRAHVRSVNVNVITFATGSWEVTPDQVARLQALADGILRVLNENSSSVFLIEGHTDAVGGAEDNLSLSDRRAEAVAEILTTHFQIPPENLVTQGYGEQHLRVPTDGPSRENRRVEVRNITGLMAGPQGGQPGRPGRPGLPPG